MFDDVSGRYDLLNRVMTLGQDSAWREAMAARVPESAHRVLDLCTGSGASLTGLHRPGRTVVGLDVSLAMLRVADEGSQRHWAPALVCADGFQLPLRAGSIDAVTVAFGIRNLRPREQALAEIHRVLAPGGRLVVLEATAPGRGPLAPFARFWIRRMIPLAGRLSPDPSAYRYLAQSIFEFGSGPEFEAALDAAGYHRVESRAFLFRSARLWVAERLPADGHRSVVAPAGSGAPMRNAMPGGRPAIPAERGWAREVEAARLLQAAVSLALAAALLWALVAWFKVRAHLPLSPPQRVGGWLLLGGGFVVFSFRTVTQAMRWLATRGAGSTRG